MVRKDGGFTSLADMGGATICVLAGTTTELNPSEPRRIRPQDPLGFPFRHPRFLRTRISRGPRTTTFTFPEPRRSAAATRSTSHA